MIYMGIDPDLKKSGYAIWDSQKRTLDVGTITFYDLIDNIAVYDDVQGTNFCVVLEAGWLNRKSDFHIHKNRGVGIVAATSRNVGENHATGKLIEEYLKRREIVYGLIKPVTAKWDAKTFKIITGLNIRTNSEMRDAAKLVYGK